MYTNYYTHFLLYTDQDVARGEKARKKNKGHVG